MNIDKLYLVIKGYTTAYLVRYNRMPFLKVFRYYWSFRTNEPLIIRNYDRNYAPYIQETDLARVP